MSEFLKGDAEEGYGEEFSPKPELVKNTFTGLHPEITGENDPVVKANIRRESGQLPSGKRYQREIRYYP